MFLNYLEFLPNEVFKVKNRSNMDYEITQELMVYVNVDKDRWTKSVHTIADFLNGTLKIYKNPEKIGIFFKKYDKIKYLCKIM